MMAPRTKGRSAALAACVVALTMFLAACGGDDEDEGGGSGESGGDATLQLAHSYTEDQPQHRCGAQVIADEVGCRPTSGCRVEIFSSRAKLGA